jgi:hypothetical protein
MGAFEGTVAPDVNTTKTAATTAPSYLTDYLNSLSQAGQTALNKPADQQVAPLTAMQQQGYAAVPAAATSYQPQLAEAQKTAGLAAQGATQGSIQNFMNPYTHNVVDEMSRLSQQNVQNNLMPSMKAGFVGTGGLGSQRYANALGQSMTDVQSNLTGQQYGALNAGYNSALQAALKNAEIQNQAATTQGNLAGQEQTLGLTGAGALTKAGGEQQAFEQAKIDAPLKTATNASALMRGYQVPTSTTETYKGPLAGVYGPSVASQITGAGAMLGSGLGYTTDKNGNKSPNWIQGLWDSWKSSNTSGSGSGGGGGNGLLNNGDGTFTNSRGELVDGDGNAIIV